MAAGFRRVTVAEARALIARALETSGVPQRVGDVLLAPHQAHAAARLSRILARDGGALLADDVGLGKTFCALAVAAAYRRVLVLHPATLRAMWSDALARTRSHATLASYESFSRGSVRNGEWDLVILDEAHHARSATARRYARIARACAGADTLLLTATPLHNRRSELQALFALFMGERARHLDEATLRRLVVRRRHDTVPAARLPPVHPPRWIVVPDDAVTLDLLEKLPPPLAPADGGDAGVLLAWSLVRRWASSRAALRATLRRQLARAVAMQDMLEAGRLPTVTELGAWTFRDDVVQAALPGFAPAFIPPPTGAVATLPDAAAIVAAHAAGVRHLLQHLRDSPDVDDLRAQALRALRAAHAGEKILAFSEFAETVHAYWHRLKRDPGVGRLTARGGEIASGTLPREQVLHRFAPAGSRRAAPRASEAIDLLVTTDLLAEGVDLRDATVVVHLDLPWSPARLEQRVGRARRLGSLARRISVHAMRPPAPSEAFLAVERRLRAKAEAARVAIGMSNVVLPDPEPRRDALLDRSGPERISAVLDRIATWGDVEPAHGRDADAPLGYALAQAPGAVEGCLAVVSVGGEPHLVAGFADGANDITPRVGDSIASVERAVELLHGASDAPHSSRVHGPACVHHGAARVERWSGAAAAWAAERAGEASIGPVTERRTALADRLLARTASAWAELPVDRRAVVGRRVERVRALAGARLPAGIVAELESLASDRSLAAEAWLDAADSVAIRRGAGRGSGGIPRAPDGDSGSPPGPGEDGVRLLVLFSPDRASPSPA